MLCYTNFACVLISVNFLVSLDGVDGLLNITSDVVNYKYPNIHP